MLHEFDTNIETHQRPAVNLKTTNSNPLRNLVELTCRGVESNTPDAVDLHVHLMVHPDEMDIGDYAVKLHFSSLMICVEAAGCNTDPVSKYGVRKNDAVAVTKKKVEKSLKTAVSESVAIEAVVEGNFDVMKPSLKLASTAKGAATSQREIALAESEEIESRSHNVEAIGNDRWRVEHEDRRALRGNYSDDERFCRLIKSTTNSNRFGARVTAQVRKRDIETEVTENRKLLAWSTPNRDKILALLLTENLAAEEQDRSGEAITFATSEFHDAG